MTEISKMEAMFFLVLDDLKDYLGDLTLVGGWMPYIYKRFLWKNVTANPVTTVDVDFGFGEKGTKNYSKTIFEKLSKLDYTESHFKIGKMYPVTLCKKGKMPIDFIASNKAKNEIIEKFIGRQITINKVDKFDFLINHRMFLNIKNKKKEYRINCPKPSAFLFHKGETFTNRESEQKQAKDLHYIYFILRYAPDIDIILKEVAQYVKEGSFKDVSGNIHKYFERISSEGCLMVEKENGKDEYIDDLRQDIFERFSKLKELF